MSPPTKMRQHRVGLRVRAPAAALMVALLLSHAHEPLARLAPEHAANHSAVHRPRGMISPAREQVGVLRAVPSGPEPSRAVPSGPRAPQSLPESPRPLGRQLRGACFL